jgi:hypothetical protein
LYIIATIIIFWWVFFNKGYLEVSDRLESETVTGRYGYFKTKFTMSDFKHAVSEKELAAYNKFWAPNDYIQQGSAEHEFSIFTNFGITNVTRGNCSEDPQYDVTICKTNNDCLLGKQSPNGIQTGNCVNTTLPQDEIPPNRRLVCEVESWCPVAVWPPLKKGAVLSQTKDTVISIRNFVDFTKFGIQRRTANREELGCYYDQTNNSHCPNFRLGDVVRFSKNNNHTYEEIAAKSGAIFEIRIEWNCSFGVIFKEDVCDPEFSFWRRDDENSDPPPLWAFWQFEKLDPTTRILKYGWRIKFNIVTTGYARRFSWAYLILSLGAYLATLPAIEFIFRLLVSWLTSNENLEQENVVFCDRVTYGLNKMKILFERTFRKNNNHRKHYIDITCKRNDNDKNENL